MRSESRTGGYVPMPDIKTVLHPLATAVQADLKSLGHDLVMSQALELVAASFGFYSYKLMLRSNPRLHTPRQVSTEFSQFRPASVEERAKRLLEVDDLRAMRISALVTSRMRESGLGIHTLDAFLRNDESARSILSALGSGYKHFELVNATTAMHVGLIPKLASDAPLIAPVPGVHGRLGSWADVIQALAKRDVRLWRWPDPSCGNNVILAEQDVYRPSPLGVGPGNKYSGSAELGLGLSLVTEESYTNRSGVRGMGYTLWTPLHNFRSDGGWHTEWNSDGWLHDPSQPERLRGRLMPTEVSGLPVARYCPECRQIFVEGEVGALAHRPHD